MAQADASIAFVFMACCTALLLSGCGGSGGHGGGGTDIKPKPQPTPEPKRLPRGANGRFDCPPLPFIPSPTSIADLHPSHVSIVMAAGDSITAGFAARGDLLESRDLSFPVGKGTNDSVTLPWLLEQYSGKVEGQSTEARSPVNITSLPWNDYVPQTDNMNVAETSAKSSVGSFQEQWGYLQGNFKKYDGFDTRWKVLTVWMTANDACAACSEPIENTPRFAKWEAGIETFLVNATGSLRNTLINLVSTLDISHVAQFQNTTFTCKFFLEQFGECPCLKDGSAPALAMLDRNIHAMNKRLEKFAADFRRKLVGRKDISVVYQPFLEGFGANLAKEFLSSLDCFHPSASAHQDLAIGLWNSMLCTKDRQNQCGSVFAPNLKAVCPTVDSVFYSGADVMPAPHGGKEREIRDEIVV